MRYFLLFDDLSDPGGDLYRWDGKFLQMRMSGSGNYSDHLDSPAPGETVEELMTSLSGPGRWEEVDGEA